VADEEFVVEAGSVGVEDDQSRRCSLKQRGADACTGCTAGTLAGGCCCGVRMAVGLGDVSAVDVSLTRAVARGQVSVWVASVVCRVVAERRLRAFEGFDAGCEDSFNDARGCLCRNASR
jgi:hypothetical protein